MDNIFHHLSKMPSETELIIEAKKHNKNYNELKKEYEHAIKDLQYTQDAILKIIKENKYDLLSNSINKSEKSNLNINYRNYLCSDKLYKLRDFSNDEIAIVTGFGPTNAPTIGTLSVIYRILELQKENNLFTNIIISDLGAFNSRKKHLKILLENTIRFITFIKKLGFNNNNGKIRTHNNLDHHRVFSLVTSEISHKELSSNMEITDNQYHRLNLQGKDFSTMVDMCFTIADILEPIFNNKKKAILVVAGLEEHYYPKLSQIILKRFITNKNGTEDFIPKNAIVCALYTRMIEGFFPYVKMSKSILNSCVNLNNSNEIIKQKIMLCGEKNEHVILQMIELTSNWEDKKIYRCIDIYQNLTKYKKDWQIIKKDYLESLLNVKELWENSKPSNEINIKKAIFK